MADVWQTGAAWTTALRMTGSPEPGAAREASTKGGCPEALDAAADDTALVEATVAGDRRAFDIIVERHRRTVYQVCYRFTSNQADASDLVQDVFVRAYRGLPRFKGQSAFGTWLYRIAVNVCLTKVSLRPAAVESIGDRPTRGRAKRAAR